MQVWKAQIAIIGNSWTCEQQLRQSAVPLRRRISESIFIAAYSMHDYDEDRTEQCMQC